MKKNNSKLFFLLCLILCLIIPSSCDYVRDIDNNPYRTIEIGEQQWMARNLKTSKYNDGTPIPLVEGPSWNDLETPAYCWYDNDKPRYKRPHGALYNWYAIDIASNGRKNVCPTGWHVPSDDDWETLITTLGGALEAGGKLKKIGTSYWLEPNTGATNESGFKAVPGGELNADDGIFQNIEKNGSWWSSTNHKGTQTKIFGLDHNREDALFNFDGSKKWGISVRCVKD